MEGNLTVNFVITDNKNRSFADLRTLFNKNNGKKFSVGVSINNLSLNENDIGEFKTFLKLSPPLRSEDDRLALIQGIKENLIDVIVSDHLPEDEESKRLPFAQAATGAIGVETLLPLSLEMYHNESLPHIVLSFYQKLLFYLAH